MMGLRRPLCSLIALEPQAPTGSELEGDDVVAEQRDDAIADAMPLSPASGTQPRSVDT
jgi:hypothetical protein